MLNSYLQVKDALVRSDKKEASKYLDSLKREIETSEHFAEKNELMQVVEKMTKASDIEKQRNAFAGLSEIFWKVLSHDNKKRDLYYQYCPMKKAYWISREAVIENPYYGSRMLHCGKIQNKK
jgi:hypothetical protein